MQKQFETLNFFTFYFTFYFFFNVFQLKFKLHLVKANIKQKLTGQTNPCTTASYVYEVALVLV